MNLAGKGDCLRSIYNNAINKKQEHILQHSDHDIQYSTMICSLMVLIS